MKKVEFTKAQQIKFNNLKLTIELIPLSSWGNNIRDILTRIQWDKLRKEVFEKANNKCEICGGIGTKHPVEGHEIWEFNDDKKTQSLKRVIALCPLCHQVKHIKLTSGFGKEYGERAYNRFKEINDLTVKEAEILYCHYLIQWKERCKEEWLLDISHLSEYGFDVKELLDKKNNADKDKKPKLTYKINADDFKCPFCESINFIGNGKTSSMKNRYKCKSCNRTFTSDIKPKQNDKPLNFDNIFS